VTDAEVEVGAVSLPDRRRDNRRGRTEVLDCTGLDALRRVEDDDDVLGAQLRQRGETPSDEIDPVVRDQYGAGAPGGVGRVRRQPDRCQ
jgi:hypothetical protein